MQEHLHGSYANLLDSPFVLDFAMYRIGSVE